MTPFIFLKYFSRIGTQTTYYELDFQGGQTGPKTVGQIRMGETGLSHKGRIYNLINDETQVGL